MSKTLQKDELSTSSREQQEQNQISLDNALSQSDKTDETCSCTADMQDTQLTYADASTSSSRDLLNLFLAVSHACLKTTFETARVIDLCQLFSITILMQEFLKFKPRAYCAKETFSTVLWKEQTITDVTFILYSYQRKR